MPLWAGPRALLRSRRSRRQSVLIAATVGAAQLASTSAHATEFEVQADTAAQAYEVTSPWGDVVLQRRRLLQTIGLGVHNLQGKYRPGEADYRVIVRMRLNSDYGLNGHLP